MNTIEDLKRKYLDDGEGNASVALRYELSKDFIEQIDYWISEFDYCYFSIQDELKGVRYRYFFGNELIDELQKGIEKMACGIDSGYGLVDKLLRQMKDEAKLVYKKQLPRSKDIIELSRLVDDSQDENTIFEDMEDGSTYRRDQLKEILGLSFLLYKELIREVYDENVIKSFADYYIQKSYWLIDTIGSVRFDTILKLLSQDEIDVYVLTVFIKLSIEKIGWKLMLENTLLHLAQ